jgi:hypothetical protein
MRLDFIFVAIGVLDRTASHPFVLLEDRVLAGVTGGGAADVLLKGAAVGGAVLAPAIVHQAVPDSWSDDEKHAATTATAGVTWGGLALGYWLPMFAQKALPLRIRR